MHLIGKTLTPDGILKSMLILQMKRNLKHASNNISTLISSCSRACDVLYFQTFLRVFIQRFRRSYIRAS